MKSGRDPTTSHVTHRRVGGLLLVWMAVSLPFVYLYMTSRRVVVDEVRQHAMGVAIASAAGLRAELLEAVRSPADLDTAAYREIQHQLDHMVLANPDIRYAYTMRRSSRPFAPPTAYEYVVDQPARDRDQDGVVSRDEQSELPGQPYDATDLPALVMAWDGPAADPAITPDPPYPDLISGYAPVRNAEGRTVAIVGVDITAATVRSKLWAIQAVMFAVWLVVCVLVTMVSQLYCQQRDALEQNARLNQELEVRNELLRQANERLAQVGPGASRPAQDAEPRLAFDRYDFAAVAAGPDQAGAFEMAQDLVGLYLGHAPASGVEAALFASSLRLAIDPMAAQPSSATTYADLTRPEDVLCKLDELLAKELPPGVRLGFFYAVVDLGGDTARYVVSGMPSPFRWEASTRQAHGLDGRGGDGLGGRPAPEPVLHRVPLLEGDKLVVCSPPLLAVRSPQGELFGANRLLEVLARSGAAPAQALAATLRDALARHAGRPLTGDDGSFVIGEMR